MQPARSNIIHEWAFIEPTDLANDKNRRLFAYWSERCVGETLPGRRDIDPIEMNFILGRIVMVDVLRDPLNFRYRMAGTRVTRDLGFDPTGQLLDTHPDPTYQEDRKSVV